MFRAARVVLCADDRCTQLVFCSYKAILKIFLVCGNITFKNNRVGRSVNFFFNLIIKKDILKILKIGSVISYYRSLS